MSIVVRMSVGGLLIVGYSSVATAQVGPNSRPEENRNFTLEPQRMVDTYRTRSMGLNYGTRNFAAGEQKVLRQFEKQITSNPQAARAGMAQAAAAITSPDGKYIFGALELQLAEKLNDAALRASATDMVIASGMVPAASLPSLLRNQGMMAIDAHDVAKAESAFGRLAALSPSDPETAIILAQIKVDAGKPAEALLLFDRGISLKRSTNQPVPPVWVKVAEQVRSRVAASRR